MAKTAYNNHLKGLAGLTGNFRRIRMRPSLLCPTVYSWRFVHLPHLTPGTGQTHTRKKEIISVLTGHHDRVIVVLVVAEGTESSGAGGEEKIPAKPPKKVVDKRN
jgi:hypothetical protein